jgi:hypothetical protein
MHQEIEFFHEKLLPKSGICWESLIAHIIPRMPTFITFGDSCLEGAGGYSLSLGFWWHLPFPEEVKLRTLLHKQDNADGGLISINILEFVIVIINYCAALHMVLSTNPTNDPYPVLLNVTDNLSALSVHVPSLELAASLHASACSKLISLSASTPSGLARFTMLSPITFLVQRLPFQSIPTHTSLLTIRPSNRSTRS